MILASIVLEKLADRVEKLEFIGIGKLWIYRLILSITSTFSTNWEQ